MWQNERVLEIVGGRQGGAGINCSSSGAGGVEKWLPGPPAFGCVTRAGDLLGTDTETEV